MNRGGSPGSTISVQDLRYSTRRLVKTPAFTLIAIVTLALGIGANTAIFSLLDAVVLKPLPVPDAGELVMFHENGPEGKADATGGTGRFLRFSYPRFARLEQALGTRGSMAAVTRSSRFHVTVPGDSERHFIYAQMVTGRYFDTLGVQPARGRVITPDDARLDRESAVAVISDRFWRRLFNASDDALGRTVMLSGVPMTIVGVTPPGFVGLWSDSESDMWVPLPMQLALRYANNSSSYGLTYDDKSWLSQDLIAWLNLFARVPGPERSEALPALVSANQAGLAELAAALTDARERESMLKHTLVVEPFSRGFSFLRNRFSDALFALTGMVALVLIVTCANIANLLLARAAGHARDVGIRISLGASTGRLVRQGLTESLTLALIGGAAGLLLGEWGSAYLARQVLAIEQSAPARLSAGRALDRVCGARVGRDRRRVRPGAGIACGSCGPYRGPQLQSASERRPGVDEEHAVARRRPAGAGRGRRVRGGAARPDIAQFCTHRSGIHDRATGDRVIRSD